VITYLRKNIKIPILVRSFKNLALVNCFFSQRSCILQTVWSIRVLPRLSLHCAYMLMKKYGHSRIDEAPLPQQNSHAMRTTLKRKETRSANSRRLRNNAER
jgi:hypothetical protein